MTTTMKTNTDQATARPWEYASTDQWEQYLDIFQTKTARTIARTINSMRMEEQRANAALIVQAVNERDALLAVAETATAALAIVQGFHGTYNYDRSCKGCVAASDLRDALANLAKVRESSSH